MASSKTKYLKPIFDRYMKWRLKELLHPEYPVVLEYPIQTVPRYGEGKPAHLEMAAILARNDATYQQTLLEIAAFTDSLAQISEAPGKPGECHWENNFFSAMDAISLYGILGAKKPALYLEVGSGNSTMFARRAVRDLQLKTRIHSIDPAPRAEVDALCDQVVRKPLEDVDTSTFNQLQPGDILFIDNSHRIFQNSDATVFFLEILPRLKPGIIVHIHDIFLPYDYPTVWAERHYSEQYVLAAFLLAEYSRMDVMLPLAYLSQQPAARKFVDQAWPQAPFQRSFTRYRELTGGYTGVSFWLTMK